MSKATIGKSPVRGKATIYLKPPISYYGGKQSLLSVILPMIPSHRKYVEPFLGGGAVYWSKEPSAVEVINDLDGFVSNFYQVVKGDLNGLLELLKSTVYGRETHDRACAVRQNSAFFSPVQRAWAFFVLANSSIYSQLDNTCKLPTEDANQVRSFYNKVARLDQSYADRLSNTFVEQRDALYVIRKNDAIDTFFFIDPPYFNSDCGHYDGYTEAEYELLLKLLEGVAGKFILTCYPSALAERYAASNGWQVFQREMQLSAGGKGKRKIEQQVTNF